MSLLMHVHVPNGVEQESLGSEKGAFLFFVCLEAACQADVIKPMLYEPILSGRIGKWTYVLVDYDFACESNERPNCSKLHC